MARSQDTYSFVRHPSLGFPMPLQRLSNYGSRTAMQACSVSMASYTMSITMQLLDTRYHCFDEFIFLASKRVHSFASVATRLPVHHTLYHNPHSDTHIHSVQSLSNDGAASIYVHLIVGATDKSATFQALVRRPSRCRNPGLPILRYAHYCELN